MEISSSENTSSSNGYDEVRTAESVALDIRTVVLETASTPLTTESHDPNQGYEAEQTHVVAPSYRPSNAAAHFEHDIAVPITPTGQADPASALSISSNHSIRSPTNCFVGYFERATSKVRGVEGEACPKRKPVLEMLISALLSFLAILTISSADEHIASKYLEVGGTEIVFLGAFYAATGVLLFDQFKSPVAQPRNVVGGYFISSLTGVSMRYLGDTIRLDGWITAAFSTALSLVLMDITRTVHPPAAACGLVAVIGGSSIRGMGFWYVVTSVCSAFIMLIFAVIGNNLFASRQYPLYWY